MQKMGYLASARQPLLCAAEEELRRLDANLTDVNASAASACAWKSAAVAPYALHDFALEVAGLGGLGHAPARLDQRVALDPSMR